MTLKERIIDNYGWMRGYNRSFLTSDMLTAIMLTVLLVPQALAYAMLADLPPQAGIYAAIFPPVIYAFFGSSRMLSVGPVAIVSIMTAYAIGSFPPELRVISAAMLAMLSGGFLMVFGLLRGGAVSTFFSRPVVTAYISGAALLIILSQFKNLLQINVSGSKISELLPSVLANLGETHALTAFVGLGTIALLWGFKRFVVLWLRLLHVKKRKAQLVGKLGPIIVVALSTLATVFFKLDTDYGLATVGYIPASLPHLNFPVANLDHWRNLILAALLISLVGFVDSVSVAQTLAAKLRH
ncbi:SulP family inorganic anion transporter, partial [uncultured Kiloniella sp.]|uniref:SulP family inorganic anion transporter n=1 Tax=uncultured Kiloniella sp. TaxID=1133091 RepID=UPI00260F0C62